MLIWLTQRPSSVAARDDQRRGQRMSVQIDREQACSWRTP